MTNPLFFTYFFHLSISVIGNFLAVFSLFAIVLLFVTSADSGSLVIDCMAANGDPDPPKIQRIFWSFSEGALASALIAAGGAKGLKAFQVSNIYFLFHYLFLI